MYAGTKYEETLVVHCSQCGDSMPVGEALIVDYGYTHWCKYCAEHGSLSNYYKAVLIHEVMWASGHSFYGAAQMVKRHFHGASMRVEGRLKRE